MLPEPTSQTSTEQKGGRREVARGDVVLGVVLIALGATGLASALVAFVDLVFRADRFGLSPFSNSSFASFGFQQSFVVNQATFAPLILVGVAFVRGWRRRPLFVLAGAVVGLVPTVLYYHERMLAINPWNYGSVFALLLIAACALCACWWPRRD